jgi:hypothetical protein
MTDFVNDKPDNTSPCDNCQELRQASLRHYEESRYVRVNRGDAAVSWNSSGDYFASRLDHIPLSQKKQRSLLLEIRVGHIKMPPTMTEDETS